MRLSTDTIRTSIATQPEWRFSALAQRIGDLPRRTAAEMAMEKEPVGSI